MRSTLVAAIAIVVGLALVASSGASASRAPAQEAGAPIFYGFISPGGGGAPPPEGGGNPSGAGGGRLDLLRLHLAG